MKPLKPVHVRTRSSAWLTAVSQRLQFDIIYSHDQPGIVYDRVVAHSGPKKI